MEGQIRDCGSNKHGLVTSSLASLFNARTSLHFDMTLIISVLSVISLRARVQIPGLYCDSQEIFSLSDF